MVVSAELRPPSDSGVVEPRLPMTEPIENRTEQVGYRFLLPRRPRFLGRAVGLGLFGLAFIGVPTLILIALFTADEHVGLLMSLGFLAFTLPFYVGGLSAWLFAARSVAGRTEVVVTPDSLRTIELIGPLSWTIERPLAGLRNVFVVERGKGQGSVWAVRADFEDAKALHIATGYPRAKLLELARNLREATNEWSERQLDLPEDPEALVRSSPVSMDLAPDATAPATDIVLERSADGLVIDVPPRGVWKGSRGLFLMGWLVIGFTLLVDAVVLFAALGGAGSAGVLPVLFMMIFLLAGAACVATGWEMGRRSARIQLDRDELVVDRDSPFRPMVHRFERGSVEDVFVDASNLKINGKMVMELKIKVHGSPTLGLLSQREVEELEWIAAALRGALTRPERETTPTRSVR